MPLDRRRVDDWLADPRVAGLLRLFRGALRPPPGGGRITLALFIGMLCHVTFGLAVLAMMVAMFFGMGEQRRGQLAFHLGDHGLRTRARRIAGRTSGRQTRYGIARLA